MTAVHDTLQIAKTYSAGRDPAATAYFTASGLPLLSTVIALLDSSDDCIKVINPSGYLEVMSCNGLRAMEIDDFDSVRGTRWSSLWPDESRLLVEDAVAEARAGRSTRFEAYCPTAKGDPRWWELTVTPVPDDDGRIVSILSTSRDITERSRRTRELEAIAQEMRHRLRNAFAVSAAVTTASAREAPEHGTFARMVADRLILMAGVQAGLLDFSDRLPLDELARRTLPIESTGARIAADGLPAVMLGGSAAKAIGLALGELATNSLKYGALATGGSIQLSAELVDGCLTITWDEERGDHPLSPGVQAPSSGQGVVIIERMLGSIGGSIESGRTESGYRARLTATRLDD